MATVTPLARRDAGKCALDRALSVFSDVRAGEGLSALLLAANVFYLLAFYQVLKIVRDALILSESGAVAASYASAGMAAVLFAFVPAYGALASRVNRVWLICGVAPFFLAGGAAYARYLPGGAGGDETGVDLHGGLGFLFPAGIVVLEAEATGHAVILDEDDLQFLAVTLGVALPF
jgi:hypothetical protein